MVPQGKNWSEWQYCAQMMLSWGCSTIAVAKRYEMFAGGRQEAVRLLQSLGCTTHIHFLGCCKDPIKEMQGAVDAALHVRGIDTAAAFAYAREGTDLLSGKHVS